MNRVSRRKFIKQLGAAAGVGIPFLTSKVAMGQTTTAPLRVLFVPIQHGWGVDKRVQAFEGTPTNFTIPSILRFLNPIRNQCVFVDGVRSIYWGNAHDVAYSDMLTCGVPFQAPSDRALGGPFMRPRNASLDWVLGNSLNKNVMRLSHGYRSWGAQFHPMSWDSGLNRLTYHTTARSAWNEIISPLQGSVGNPTPVNRTDQQSLFDYLGDDAQRLLNRPNVPRVKVERYLSALNTLGNRILEMTPTAPISSIPLPGQPAVSQSFNDQMDNYLEMIRIGFAYDTHRVGVLGLGQGANFTWTRPDNGQVQNGNTLGNDFHQDVAHYGKLPNYNPHPVNYAAYEGWIQWYGNKIVNFANSLNAIEDVNGGTLLDNTLIVLFGEVGNGTHDQRDMTYVLIGGGNRLNRGRWISTPKVEPRNRQGVFLGSVDVNNNVVESGINYGSPYSRHHVADLWVSIARLAGVPLNSFGFPVYNHQPIQL